MRILIVSPVLPYPPSSGFLARVYHLARLLGQRHQVTLLAYARDPADRDVAALRGVCHAVHTVPPPVATGAKRLQQLLSVLSPVSYQWRSHRSVAMQEKLDALARSEQFDIIQVESSQMACFEFDRRAALVLDEHNIEYELLYRTFQTEHSAIRRAYNWIEFQKFKREETGAWRKSAGVVTTSAREAAMIREILPGVVTRSVPNGVDVEYFTPAEQPEDAEAIVFTGLMKYRPNVDAAGYFVREVLPKILAGRPNAMFYIVGGEPPEEVTSLAGPNVVVTGTVPDVRPYVRRAAVFVVPLRMGSGTRLKVLEGLAMNKPMVSTSLGCEGIDVENGRHLLIADDPATFANDVLRLMSDRQFARRLSAEGQALVNRSYRWETIVTELEDVHREVMSRSATSR